MADVTTEILRMIERLLVVGFGGMAIFLGYRLFFHLPHTSDHKGEITLPGIKVVLSRVAPGIFFLIFGSYILINSHNKGITKTLENSVARIADDKTKVSQTFVGALPDSFKENKTTKIASVIAKVGELNCLLRMLEKTKHKNADYQKLALIDAKVALLKPVWNEQAWGKFSDFNITEKITKNNNPIYGVFHDESVSCQF